jgi:hypothetical protein
MATKMATPNKNILRPNGFGSFFQGFKSLSLRHKNIPVFVKNTGMFLYFSGFCGKWFVLSRHKFMPF